MNIDDLKRFAPGGEPVILAGLSATSEDLYEAGIDTPPRICHFMAQIAHESDGLQTMMEYASGAAYESRDNSEPGDGRKFKGHGLTQTTSWANHRAFKAWAESCYPGCPDFEKMPEQLAQMPWALRSAIWCWSERGLNRYVDKNDIRSITKRINGAFRFSDHASPRRIGIAFKIQDRLFYGMASDSTRRNYNRRPVRAPARQVNLSYTNRFAGADSRVGRILP
ncbi:glycoside hydrolase family 19 protein [Rhizobium beringeri]|uniref:glycoside hydrolase family 19 protein n=1 Tax=Rhizobium beringeri TaxID=3019934 RepID=UPI00399048A8